MVERTTIPVGGKMLSFLLEAAKAAGAETPNLPYDIANLKRAFCDADLVDTCLNLFANDLNVSRTAKALYMHRNTLIYRINKLRKTTGLDVCTFGGAVDFIILYLSFKKEKTE